MIFTQPVIHEFGNISVPTTLIIGGKDRTAPGGNRASADVAKTLDNPKLGRAAAVAIPSATLFRIPRAWPFTTDRKR
ncbi:MULTISPECIES: hypothetical protein [unclassified Mesorhizobium]|nr:MULTISPECIES: hypothetical protein [unclassified Mesorhizobium]